MLLLLTQIGLANDRTINPKESRFSISESISKLREQGTITVLGAEKTCGVRSAYIMLRLHGWQGDYGEVEKRIPVGDNGSSMTDIESAMRELGYSFSNVVWLPERISELPVPAIALVGDNAAIRHFVVVTAVTEFEVVFLEPSGLTEKRMPRANFTQLTTGYYVVDLPRSLGVTGRIAVFLLGVLIAVLSIFIFVRQRQWLGAPPGVSTSVCAVLVMLLFSNGCTPPHNGPSTSKTNYCIDVPRDFMQVNVNQSSDKIEYTFPFRNISLSTINIELGAPSCRCLAVQLSPKDRRMAEGQEGAVTLSLHVTDEGGLQEARVPVFVSDSDEAHFFTLRALAEGLAHDKQPIVIRRRHLENDSIPPVKFQIFTRERDTPFQIVSAATHESPIHWLKPDALEARYPREVFVGKGPPIKQLRVRTDEIAVGMPKPYHGVLYVREIVIPISVLTHVGIGNSTDGHLAVKYRIRQESPRVGMVDILMLADDEN